MVNIGHNTGNYNLGGGGGDFPVFTLGAAGLAGWSVFELYSFSALLALSVGAFALFAFICCFVANSGFVRFLLVLSILCAAAVGLYVRIGNYQLAMTLVIAAAVLFVAALLFGLWRDLGWWNIAAVACVVILVGGANEQRDRGEEQWRIAVDVKDQFCGDVDSASVTCEAVSTANGDVVWSGGPQYTDTYGDTEFSVRGRPTGRTARCTANKEELGGGSGTGDPGVFGFANVRIQLVPPDSTSPPSTCAD